MEPLAERLGSMGLSYAAPMERLSTVPPSRAVVQDLLCGILNGFSQPLEFLVGDDASGRRTKLTICRAWGRPLPYGSLVMVGGGLMVSSPEFAFYQLVRGMTAASMVLLGHELAAVYARSSIDARGFRPCPPLSSAVLLDSYLSRSEGTPRGLERYRRPLACVRDGAASPMESVLSTRLALPRMSGGYGVGGFELNGQIDVSVDDAQGGKRTVSYFGDLVWRDRRLVVEYDSEQFHTGARRIDEDARRRNELHAHGFTVVTVTKQQMYDVGAFHKVALQIAKLSGTRIQEKRASFDWASRREVLAKELLDKRNPWSQLF